MDEIGFDICKLALTIVRLYSQFAVDINYWIQFKIYNK